MAVVVGGTIRIQGIIMLLEKTGWTSIFYLGYKEGLTEEAGFPMVEATKNI